MVSKSANGINNILLGEQAFSDNSNNEVASETKAMCLPQMKLLECIKLHSICSSSFTFERYEAQHLQKSNAY